MTVRNPWMLLIGLLLGTILVWNSTRRYFMTVDFFLWIGYIFLILHGASVGMSWRAFVRRAGDKGWRLGWRVPFYEPIILDYTDWQLPERKDCAGIAQFDANAGDAENLLRILQTNDNFAPKPPPPRGSCCG